MNIYLPSLTGQPNPLLWKLGYRVYLHKRLTKSIMILKYVKER